MRFSLCEYCFSSIRQSEGQRCFSCGKLLISEKDICISCRINPNKFERLFVLYPYAGKYRALLTGYKFNKILSLADFFAEKTTELLAKADELKDASLVPVPPRAGKIKSTGWDQVDYLVKRLKKLNRSLDVSYCLKRGVSNTQKSLNRSDRQINMKGKIFAKGKVPRKALLIDDVITTGSTMQECAHSLKENGAEKVYGLCLFYD